MIHKPRQRQIVCLGLLAAIGLGALAQAQTAPAPQLPATAVRLMGDGILKQLANRSFRFTVHDTGFEAHGTSTWDPALGEVHGDVVWGPHYSGPWRKEWKVTEGHSCFRNRGVPTWDCYRIYVDGPTHYEVRDDGVIHSIHVPAGD